MRKHLVLATLIGFCALSVTACQRGENKPTAPAGGATAEQTTSANPGSESLTTAANGMQTDQSTNNGTPELAASSTNSAAPAGPDMMQNQSTDNAQPAMGSGSAMPPAGNPDAGAGAVTNPSDQSGTTMPDNMPSSTAPAAPSDQNAGMGSNDNTATGTGTGAPATGDNMENKSDSNTSPGSSMPSDTPK